ncbi:MAG: hypothetical protein E7375_00090 [Clostridiales bacterium]|nr:hypothetical protein [Clostridiales bacterium]
MAICLIIPCAFALSACGKDDDKLTKAQYLAMFNSVSTACANYIASAEPEAQVLAVSYNINDNDYEEVDNEEAMVDMIKANVAFIYLIENIYSRDDYVVNNGIDEYIVRTLDWTAKARMKVEYNKSTNITTTTIYWTYGNNIQYFVFDIDYNYKTEKLNSFTITGCTGTDMSIEFETKKIKFNNNKIYLLDENVEYYDEFKTDVKNDMLAFRTFNKATADLPDYSVEYADACVKAGI